MIISLDTETTGLDLHHGSRVFIVTTYTPTENITWEWEVDPLTRKPRIPRKDKREVMELIGDAKKIRLQNSKFDVRALQATFGNDFKWDWSKVDDTLIAGHLLHSSQPHDLATMSLLYLDTDIAKYEQVLKDACNKARTIVRRDYTDWRIAKAGLPDMPSVKGTAWKNDLWLPKAIAEKEGYPEDHPWHTVTATYADYDSASTYYLFDKMKAELKDRGLWKLYKQRVRILPIAYNMEERGVTLNKSRLDQLTKEYIEESEKAENTCVTIAKVFDADLWLPKSGNNKSLTDTVFNKLELPVIKKSKKTGNPSMDKGVLEHWEATLPHRDIRLKFVRALRSKRKRDTALNYMEGYERFWFDVGNGYYKLQPSVNPTGTNTLRWSSNNPNSQNISKQEGFNLRYCFGPAPGREWWALDYDNLELRIPAYECQEPAMLELFENPDKPPYYGSYHLLVFDILHPEMFAEHGVDVAKKYKSTWYGWTKAGNFAELYGAVESSGTADFAYHVQGAQRIVAKRLTEKSKLNKSYIKHANEHGFVYTMPDKSVDSSTGYPLECPRLDRGKISPTVPLNYHVQGTACWIMGQAMMKVDRYLKRLTEKTGQDHFITMQVHDEIVLDFPARPNKANLPRVEMVRGLMQSIGKDLIPEVKLTCGIDHHPNNWSETE